MDRCEKSNAFIDEGSACETECENHEISPRKWPDHLKTHRNNLHPLSPRNLAVRKPGRDASHCHSLGNRTGSEMIHWEMVGLESWEVLDLGSELDHLAREPAFCLSCRLDDGDNHPCERNNYFEPRWSILSQPLCGWDWGKSSCHTVGITASSALWSHPFASWWFFSISIWQQLRNWLSKNDCLFHRSTRSFLICDHEHVKLQKEDGQYFVDWQASTRRPLWTGREGHTSAWPSLAWPPRLLQGISTQIPAFVR